MRAASKLQEQVKQFDSAVARLKEALGLPWSEISRDATIKRFEFTFELSWKLVKSFAKLQGMDTTSPADVIRVGAQLGLIDNPGIWLGDFLEGRNMTAHVYAEDLADKVYAVAKKFLPEAEELLSRMKNKLVAS